MPNFNRKHFLPLLLLPMAIACEHVESLDTGHTDQAASAQRREDQPALQCEKAGGQVGEDHSVLCSYKTKAKAKEGSQWVKQGDCKKNSDGVFLTCVAKCIVAPDSLLTKSDPEYQEKPHQCVGAPKECLPDGGPSYCYIGGCEVPNTPPEEKDTAHTMNFWLNDPEDPDPEGTCNNAKNNPEWCDQQYGTVEASCKEQYELNAPVKQEEQLGGGICCLPKQV